MEQLYIRKALAWEYVFVTHSMPGAVAVDVPDGTLARQDRENVERNRRQSELARLYELSGGKEST